MEEDEELAGDSGSAGEEEEEEEEEEEQGWDGADEFADPSPRKNGRGMKRGREERDLPAFGEELLAKKRKKGTPTSKKGAKGAGKAAATFVAGHSS